MERVKTRGELKAELSAEIPEGEETNALSEAECKLEEMNTRLQQLQEQRATIRRGLTIRERKLRDWKGKIPRTGDIPNIEEILHTTKSMSVSCVKVGIIDNEAETVTMGGKYIRALNGLSGFEKVWLVALEDNTYADTLEPAPSLVLVDVVNCNEKNGKIKIGGLDKQFRNGIILDIKPYLPYCEALPLTKVDSGNV